VAFGLYSGCNGFVGAQCLYGTPGAVWTGPAPTKQVRQSPVFAAAPYYYPNGYVTYVAADGHAATGELYNEIYEGVQDAAGVWYAKHFWPAGR
jgi:hypothetical protein